MNKKVQKSLRILLILFIFLLLCLQPHSIKDSIYCIMDGTGPIIGGGYSNCCILHSHGSQYDVYIDGTSINIYRGKKIISKYNSFSRESEIISSFVSDINRDNNDEIILLSKHRGDEYGDNLTILSYDGIFAKVLEESVKYLNPWKVQAGDIDGDNENEISLGVYTVSTYRKDLAKRPFIYNYAQNKLYPKWLGSRLSKPFGDYIFSDMDMDKMDELVSVEYLKDGRKDITAYKWTGFGFEGLGSSNAFYDIKSLKQIPGGAAALVYKNKKWIPECFKLFEGVLTEYEE